MNNTKENSKSHNYPVEKCSVPVPIANALTYSFIDSIVPGAVLTQVIDDELLRTHNEFNEPFFMTMYQNNENVFYFAYQQSAYDAEKAFKIYCQHQHSSNQFNRQLVIVNDKNKFIDLANKTSPGCGTKAGSFGNDFHTEYLDHFYKRKNGYVMLDKWKVSSARKVQEQERPWACGPNSALRSLYLLGRQWNGSYESFLKGCPQWISKDKTIENGGKTMAVGSGALALGAFFAPATGGLSLLPGMATFFTGTATAVTGAAIKSDVGPKPSSLASFITKKFSTYSASEKPYDSQVKYEKDIMSDIDCGYPRIVLMVFSTTKMHYMNVIGYKPDDDGKYIEKVVLLDTDKNVGWMTDSRFKYWFKGDMCSLYYLDPFTTVEFHKK
eukprot:351026_1